MLVLTPTLLDQFKTIIYMDDNSLVCRCRRLPKGLKDWQAFLDLKKRVDDFSESCPLLEMMANNSMKQRHWNRITDLTKHTFDVESESFALKNIMEAPLLQHKEDIEVGRRLLTHIAPLTLNNHQVTIAM